MIAQEKSDTYWVKKYAGGMEFDIYAQAAQRFSGENPIIFDVGANIGMTSLFFSRVPSAKVEAFEPVERTFSFLQKNLSNNHIDNVRTHNIGFSNRSGELAIGGEKPEESSGTFKVREKSDHGYSEIARFETMDEFVKRLKIDHVDYVKIDCEGHEINIIEGCKEVILKFDPVFQLEVHTSIKERGEHARQYFRKFIDDGNYHVYQIYRGVLEVDDLDTLFAQKGINNDLVLVPASRL